MTHILKILPGLSDTTGPIMIPNQDSSSVNVILRAVSHLTNYSPLSLMEEHAYFNVISHT